MPPAFLIADDSREKVAMLRAIVEKNAPHLMILTAATTADANAVIAAHPQIIGAFVDYYIPEDNGPAIIRALRAAAPQAGIALTSSSPNLRNATEARKAGADTIVCTSDRLDIVETTLAQLVTEWTEANQQ